MVNGAHIRLVLGRAAKAVEKVDRASIADTGLNISDFSIMEALLHKGALPVNTIGEKVLLTSGSMTAAINRLEQKKLVKRIRDPSDGRIFYVHLTRPGKKLIQAAFNRHKRNLDRIVDILSLEERKALIRLLKKIGKHAQTLQC